MWPNACLLLIELPRERGARRARAVRLSWCAHFSSLWLAPSRVAGTHPPPGQAPSQAVCVTFGCRSGCIEGWTRRTAMAVTLAPVGGGCCCAAKRAPRAAPRRRAAPRAARASATGAPPRAAPLRVPEEGATGARFAAGEGKAVFSEDFRVRCCEVDEERRATPEAILNLLQVQLAARHKSHESHNLKTKTDFLMIGLNSWRRSVR